MVNAWYSGSWEVHTRGSRVLLPPWLHIAYSHSSPFGYLVTDHKHVLHARYSSRGWGCHEEKADATWPSWDDSPWGTDSWQHSSSHRWAEAFWQIHRRMWVGRTIVYFGIIMGLPNGAKMALRSPEAERMSRCGKSWRGRGLFPQQLRLPWL